MVQSLCRDRDKLGLVVIGTNPRYSLCRDRDKLGLVVIGTNPFDMISGRDNFEILDSLRIQPSHRELGQEVSDTDSLGQVISNQLANLHFIDFFLLSFLIFV